MPRSISAAVIAAALATTGLAHADATAASLFTEGKKLIAQGRERDGCQKLVESQRLEPSIGTGFHVALCHERSGRIASAVAGYLEVATMAKARNQATRERIARDKAEELEPRMLRLVVDVAGSTTPGLTIKRNGVALARSDWNTAIPSDPGAFTIEASAPEHAPWRTTIEVGMKQSTWQVQVPELERLAPGAADPVVPLVERPANGTQAEPASRWSPLRTVAIASAGAGAVALGAGVLFTVRALGAKSDAEPHCRDTMCDPIGAGLRGDAVGHGDRATLLFAAGGGLVAASAVLWLVAPGGAEKPRRAFDVAVGPRGVEIRGAW